MSVKQASFFCPTCQEQRLFVAHEFNHTPHVLISIFSCGLWLFVWLILVLAHKANFHCSNCGFSSSTADLAQITRNRGTSGGQGVQVGVAPGPGTRSSGFSQSKTDRRKLVYGIVGIFLASSVGIAILSGTKSDRTNKSKDVAGAKLDEASIPTTTLSPLPPPTLDQLKARASDLLQLNVRDEHSEETMRTFESLFSILQRIPEDSADYKAGRKLNVSLQKKYDAIKKDIEVLGPKPQHSAWDGSVRDAERWLKENLNDYSSSEYLGWTQVAKVYRDKKPYWKTTVKLRAKNSFGAYIISDITFYINNRELRVVR